MKDETEGMVRGVSPKDGDDCFCIFILVITSVTMGSTLALKKAP
jgi:hypothetical protein